MEFCPGHPGYGVDTLGNCKFCGKPRLTRVAPRSSPLGEVDPFELGRLLAEKYERERRSKIPQLSDCPNCHEPNLFYNMVSDSFTCKCGYIISPGTAEYKAIVTPEIQEEPKIEYQPPMEPTQDHLQDYPGYCDGCANKYTTMCQYPHGSVTCNSYSDTLKTNLCVKCLYQGNIDCPFGIDNKISRYECAVYTPLSNTKVMCPRCGSYNTHTTYSDRFECSNCGRVFG